MSGEATGLAGVDHSSFQLSPGLIHIWDGFGVIDPAHYSGCYDVLDITEQQRANRFRSELHRIRFVTCRGWLRLLLSAYTGVNPDAVALISGEHGKPRLKEHPPNTGLVFNVSHSSERMVFAFGLDCMLGVDIEQFRNMTKLEGLIARIGSETETANWRNTPSDRQQEFFFSLWVRKEAIIKAHGQGISLGMPSCELAENLERPLSLPGVCGDVKEWTLLELSYADNYRGAVALKGPFKSLVRRDLPEQELLDRYLYSKPG